MQPQKDTAAASQRTSSASCARNGDMVQLSGKNVKEMKETNVSQKSTTAPVLTKNDATCRPSNKFDLYSPYSQITICLIGLQQDVTFSVLNP